MDASSSAILSTSEALVGAERLAGLAQVFEIGRHVITKKNGGGNGSKSSTGVTVYGPSG